MSTLSVEEFLAGKNDKEETQPDLNLGLGIGFCNHCQRMENLFECSCGEKHCSICRFDHELDMKENRVA